MAASPGTADDAVSPSAAGSRKGVPQLLVTKIRTILWLRRCVMPIDRNIIYSPAVTSLFESHFRVQDGPFAPSVEVHSSAAQRLEGASLTFDWHSAATPWRHYADSDFGGDGWPMM